MEKRGMSGVGSLALSALLLAACAAVSTDPESESSSAVTAYCTANVGGKKIPVEDDYLPHVVMCENGGAPLEALKAQAVAARTFLYFKLETSGSVADGQGDQVYSCGKTPNEKVQEAVKATSGQVLRHGGVTLAAFFVAGGKGTPPACVGASGGTEQYVTYNEGLSGDAVKPTALGSKSNPRNRGCFSQNGSSCLASAGASYDEILRFYYGSDVLIEGATGDCVSPATVPPASADGGPPPTTETEVPMDGGGCRTAPRSAGDGLPFAGALVFLATLRNRRKKR